MSSFPTSPEELSPQWLTDKLGYDVTSFHVEALGEGGGLLGLVTRLHLDANEGPNTLIAKFPTKTEGNRAVATIYDMYAREYRFYTQVAPNVPMRSPACYHAELNEQNSDFVLLLEDLQGFELGDQVKGCSVDQAHQVIQSIASLHRNTWQPDHITDIKPHDMPYQRDGMAGGFVVGWPVVKTDFTDVLEAAITPQQIELLTIERQRTVLPRLPADGQCRGHLCLSFRDLHQQINLFDTKIRHLVVLSINRAW